MIKDKTTTIGYHCPQCGIPISSAVNIFAFSAPGNLIKLKCPCGASELTISITREKKFRLIVPCIVCPNSHTYTISSSVFFERDLFAFTCKFTALNICFIGKSSNVMEAIKNNEQELLEMFAEYDDSFDPETSDLSDVFAMNDDYDEFGEFDEGDDEEWWDEFFDTLDGLEGLEGYDDYEGSGIFDFLGLDKEPGFEVYENKNFDAETDNGLDLSFYSGFSTGKKEPFAIELDNVIEESKIKIQQYPIIMRIMSRISEFIKTKKIICKCGGFDGVITLLENSMRVECKKCDSEREIKCSDVSDADYIAEMDELVLDFDD